MGHFALWKKLTGKIADKKNKKIITISNCITGSTRSRVNTRLIRTNFRTRSKQVPYKRCLKGELQRQNKLISSERPFKIMQNETKIIKIGQAVLEIINFKD